MKKCNKSSRVIGPLGVSDFSQIYHDLCRKHDLAPVKAVTAFAQDFILDINGDRFEEKDFKPLIESLEVKNDLKFIAIRSYIKASKDENRLKTRPCLRLPQVTNGLISSVSVTLRFTSHLRCLELQNLSLELKALQRLCESFNCNHTLQHLSLQQCKIQDAGLQVLCKELKTCFNITSVNLIDCDITWQGIHCLVNVIKHQALLRTTQAWHDSLRGETATTVEQAGGVQRLSLNNNTLVGDRGAHLLAEALEESVWLRALDVQNCGVQDSGARAFLRSLKNNSTLYILDIRRNCITDADTLTRITQQLSFNVQGQSSQYKWLPLPSAPERVGAKYSSKSKMKKGIPWRVNSRLNFSRCLPFKQTPGIANIFLQSRPSVMSDSESRVEPIYRSRRSSMKEGKCKTLVTIEAEFKQLQKLLLTERRSRLDAERKVEELTLENESLRSKLSSANVSNSILDDQTLATIEETFANFSEFIGMLKLVGPSADDVTTVLKH